MFGLTKETMHNHSVSLALMPLPILPVEHRRRDCRKLWKRLHISNIAIPAWRLQKYMDAEMVNLTWAEDNWPHFLAFVVINKAWYEPLGTTESQYSWVEGLISMSNDSQFEVLLVPCWDKHPSGSRTHQVGRGVACVVRSNHASFFSSGRKQELIQERHVWQKGFNNETKSATFLLKFFPG